MKKKMLLSVCLTTFLLIAVQGHPQPSQAAAPKVHSDKSVKGSVAEPIPDMWQILIREPTPPSASETLNSIQTNLLQGKYIFSSTGARYDFALRATDVQSAIGEFNFDGRGTFTGLQISRTLFTGSSTFSYAGTYTLDSSGGGFLFYTSGQTESIIVVNRGDAFFFVDVRSSNFREAGYARKL